MRVALTGVSGFVGRRVLAGLLQQGHEVIVLSRQSAKALPSGVRVVVGDLTSPNCPAASFVAGADALLHCAGEIRKPEVMRALHVEGTGRLLQAAIEEVRRTHRPLHWVQLSSVGAYGPPPGRASADRVVTEETPTHPVGEYEVTKTEADELVTAAARSESLTCTIVRPSNIFAADMPNASLRGLGAMVRRGLFFYIGRPGAVATYVHVDDVVDTLLRCATDARARGQIFNVSNDCPLEDMINGMADALRVPRPRRRLPEAFVRFALGIAGRVVRLPLTPERVDALVIRTRYPFTKLQRHLDLAPRRSVPAAIGEVLAKQEG